jgi:AraC-like DNA-binding protein
MEYLAYIGDELTSRGLSLAEWLAVAGLTEGAVQVSDALITTGQFQVLITEAVRRAREPGLGLFIGRRLGVNSHGIVGEMAVSAETVGDAMLAIQQYSRLRTTLLDISASEVEGCVELRLRPTVALEPAVERVLLEAVTVSIQNVIREVTNRLPVIETVLFRYPSPDYADLARSVFGVDVRYDADASGLRADLAMLATPLELADPTAFEVAARICDEQLKAVSPSATVAAQVRRLMLQPSGVFPNLDVAARQLHMNPRTLHRRLTDEGTSYRQITETVRHGLALEHLRSGRFTIKELAYHLGYSDVSNFRRAFKRWEDQSPADYRRSVRSNSN